MIFENVEAISSRTSVIEREIAIERAGIDEFANQIDRRAVVPMKFVAPMARLFLKKHIEGFRMDLPEVDNLHERPRHSRQAL